MEKRRDVHRLDEKRRKERDDRAATALVNRGCVVTPLADERGRQNVVNRIAGFYPKRGLSTRTN